MFALTTPVPSAPPCASMPVATPVRLRDGASVWLREACADEAALREMFFTLSDSTRYLYFRAGVPRNEIWAAHVAQLGRAEGDGSYALVAEAGGRLVGVARFDRAGSDPRAEIGILLTDAWQSRGLGAEVVARLREEATRRALSGFTATVMGENYRAMRLLRRAFPSLRASFGYGQYELDMPF